jgi:hypothetical protein
MSNQTDLKKFVAIVDRNRTLTQIVNAVGHLALGLGRHPDTADAAYSTFKNPAAGSVSYLTDHPFIILGAKGSKQLYNLHLSLLETFITHNVFFANMFSYDVQEQLREVESINLENLEYVAIMLYGTAAELTPFIKKFSLLRNPPE